MYEHNQKTFNFKIGFEQYCCDVELLTENCIRYRLLNMLISKSNKECEIDWFRNFFTIAYCNLVYRKKFMKEISIGLIPENGYQPILYL